VADDYRIRRATAADVPTLVEHRVAMFEEIGRTFDRAALAAAFAPWVRDAIASGFYHGWIADAPSGECAGGAGLSVLPWPPSPLSSAGRIGFVYNVYVEQAHRRRGVARSLMDVLHAWCRENGMGFVALHASDAGRALYESMGYTSTNEMRRTL
jgi:GNAT superfamily N-acetyltransferase